DDPVVDKIATAEILFELGRFDRAIGLLKDLLDSHPSDQRIHRKLADLYLKSDMPQEAALAYRELARVYMAEGNTELAADCMVNARRLSGLPRESSVEVSAVNEAPASKGWSVVIGRTLAKAARKRTPLFGDPLRERDTSAQSRRHSRYWVAIVLLGVVGIAGGYFLIR